MWKLFYVGKNRGCNTVSHLITRNNKTINKNKNEMERKEKKKLNKISVSVKLSAMPLY